MQLRRASNHSIITLGKELGRGGEGAVFPVKGAPDLVAKIYHKPPTPAKADKLHGMARHSSPALLRVAAWPTDVLVDESGLARGFLMPKVSAREDLHELYSPKSRRRSFPTADFRFIVRVAANLARAFAQVHAQGNVIGDVNHGNALVGRDGTVLLIDCDSFQVRAAGRVFTCDVGVPLFTAPELHGQGFRGLKRTPNHDGFGLAVLLFHLLYLGRHPFAGVFTGGEMPIERAIAEHRFVYGADAETRGMSPPPGTLPLGSFGPELVQLFETAFAPGQVVRPTAVEWVAALQDLERRLAVCGASDLHYHPADRHCAWCAHETVTGMQVFTRHLGELAQAGAAKVARLWDTVGAVKKPEPALPMEMPTDVSKSDPKADDVLGPVPGVAFAVLLGVFGLISIVAGGLPLGLAYLGAVGATAWHLLRGGKRPGMQADSRDAMAQTRMQVKKLVMRWNELCADDRFDHLLRRLEEVKDQLQELPKQRAERLKALQSGAAERQRDVYLSMFRIDKANLKRLTAQDIAMLEAWDIDTADDLFRPGLQFPKSISNDAQWDLREWAEAVARDFKFDPSRSLDPRELRVVDESLYSAQRPLIAELDAGTRQLQELAEEIRANRSQVKEDLDAARHRLAKLLERAT